MVDQIPAMTYLVSLARSARVRTELGTYSVHHVRPEFFGGAKQDPESGIRLASPEKALVDFLYLSPTRSRLFAALPELELSKSFSSRAAQKWVGLIPSGRMRTIVEREFKQVLARAGRQAAGPGAR
jgi:hypothetical protein